MQATSAFSLESAEHCGEAPAQSGRGSTPACHPLPFSSGIFFFPSKDSPIISNILVWVRISWVLCHPLNTSVTLQLQKGIRLRRALLENKNY